MKKEELVYSIKKYVYQLIDDIMPPSSFLGKIENRTAKYWVDQNQWKLNDIVSIFTDKEGCIDEKHLVDYYKDTLFENGELRLSLTDLVGEKYKNMIPDKVILFRENDLNRLVGM